MQTFPVERWFTSFLSDLGDPEIGASAWPPSPRRMLLEALSDTSAEQLLNPLVAIHLRRFGREWAWEQALTHENDHVFWVRGEWEKVDLSYGLARPFPEQRWDEAWWDGTTGDLGQIEVKVCYTHLTPPIGKLYDQLVERRRRDQERASRRREAAHQRYHGLVCLFEHRGITEKLTNTAKNVDALAARMGLTLAEPSYVPTRPDELDILWPSFSAKPYRCGIAFRLFELR